MRLRFRIYIGFRVSTLRVKIMLPYLESQGNLVCRGITKDTIWFMSLLTYSLSPSDPASTS